MHDYRNHSGFQAPHRKVPPTECAFAQDFVRRFVDPSQSNVPTAVDPERVP